MTDRPHSPATSSGRTAAVLASLLWLVLVGMPTSGELRAPSVAGAEIALAVLTSRTEPVTPPRARAAPARAVAAVSDYRAPAHLLRRCAAEPRAPDPS